MSESYNFGSLSFLSIAFCIVLYNNHHTHIFLFLLVLNVIAKTAFSFEESFINVTFPSLSFAAEKT